MLSIGTGMTDATTLTGKHTHMVFSADEKAWLIPDLQGDNSGTKLSSWIKGMQKGSAGLGRYQDFAVKLPADPTAAGIRHGAADTLACFIQAELAVHNTGHDLTGLCALWEYPRARIALCIPGAVVLAGWPAFPYGQMGKGPVHPSLSALTGISVETFEPMIDVLFSFCDQTLPKLRVDGELRPMLHATLATMIMYYEERWEAKEMHKVLTFMREAFMTIAAPGENAHLKLIEWGRIIKGTFDFQNLHLTEKLTHSGHEQIVHTVQQLGSNLARTQVMISDITRRQVEIENKLDTLIGLLSTGAQITTASPLASTPAQPPPNPPRPTPTALPSASLSTPVAAAAAASAAASACLSGAASSSSSRVPQQSRLVHSSTRPDPVPHHLAGEYLTKRPLTSGRFFLDCSELGGVLPPALEADGRRRPDANKVLEAYSAMATGQEKEVLKLGDVHSSTAIVNRLTSLLVQRIKQAYQQDTEKPVPPLLGKGDIYFNTMVDNLRDSRLKVSSQTFTTWRTSLQSGAAVAQPSASALGKRPAHDAPADHEQPSQVRPHREMQAQPQYEELSGESGEESDEESSGESGEESGEESDYGVPCSPAKAGEWQDTAIDVDYDEED